MPLITTGPSIANSSQINPGVILGSDIANDTITNANVNSAAAIAYSKLNLAGGVVNADVGASAAIVDTKLAQITTASKVSGAALTSLASIPAGAGVIPAVNVPSVNIKTGVATYAGNTASGNQTIAHGLGVSPSLVMFFAHFPDVDNTGFRANSEGSYNGTSNVCKWNVASAGDSSVTSGNDSTTCIWLQDDTHTDYQQASATYDATNITLAWTRGGASFNTTIQIFWIAIA